MTVPVDIFHWLAAFLPILVLLVLMLKFHMKATRAAPLGVLTAMLCSITVFRGNFTVLWVESVKGLWSALTVIAVILPAIVIYELSSETRAFDSVCAGIRRLLPNEFIRILAFGLGFVGFLIGVTGFGVPVAVGAPLLIGIGVRPLYAVVIALIGESWGSTFGTLAVAWDAMRLAAGLDADPAALLRTALWAGIFIWLWNFTVSLSICWMYGRGRAIKKGLPAVLAVSLIQGGGQILMARVNSTLACLVPSVIALAVLLLLGRTRLYSQPWQIEDSPIMDRTARSDPAAASGSMDMLQALLPYSVLTCITLFVLLISPVKAFLGQWSLGFSLPETVTGYGYTVAAADKYSPVSPLTHAGFFLLVSAVTAAFFYLRRGHLTTYGLRCAVSRSLHKTLPTGFSVICFLIMSRIMSGSGQTAVLAAGMARVLGMGYALAAPGVGLLGAFMTGSNMASNILFSEFQLTTAAILHMDTAAVLGAQTAGGAIGTATCPGNVILGCTTAGLGGHEGEVMKKTLPLCLAAALGLGAAIFAVFLL